MSMNDFEKAISLIEDYSEEADFEGPKPETLIKMAESYLQVKFPPSYRAFLKTLGCGDFAGEEFYGLIHEDFHHSSVPDAIWVTLNERKSGLPKHLIIISADGAGNYYTLDTSRLLDGEAPVVVWSSKPKPSNASLERIADDFGSFFLERIRAALA